MELKSKLKNVTNGKKYITNIIETYNDNEKINNTELLTLLQYHPTKHINIENIDYLIAKIRSPYNTLALYYKYKNNDNWNNANIYFIPKSVIIFLH